MDRVTLDDGRSFVLMQHPKPWWQDHDGIGPPIDAGRCWGCAAGPCQSATCTKVAAAHRAILRARGDMGSCHNQALPEHKAGIWMLDTPEGAETYRINRVIARLERP